VTLRSGETRTEWAIRMAKEEARADERARCLKALEDLRVQTRGNAASLGVEASIAALRESNGSVGSSSPVGGEQQ
jgi:hypothetical protein